MKIYKKYLTPNEWSRPQSKIKEFRAIVIHWTANPAANAEQNWLYFEAKKMGACSYGSAHYIETPPRTWRKLSKFKQRYIIRRNTSTHVEKTEKAHHRRGTS